ncbi:MAG: helicase-associated domain-containing protein [Spirochaetes bacterium]|nr:helicase-associated domain-containing protein [Spirochaetota bacterium]
MSWRSVLLEELGKLEKEQLLRVAEVWGLTKPPGDKRALVQLLSKMFIDPYFLKTVLEKLTPLQVKIFAVILNNKQILTLGEISRKIQLQPINVEKELAVLKHIMLLYQKKNRERITHNLDKYIAFDEFRKIVSTDGNSRGEKFQISIRREVEQTGDDEYDPKYLALLGGKGKKPREYAEKAFKEETLQKTLKTLSDGEMVLLDEAFTNGGIIEINAARIIMDEQKLPMEKTIRRLDAFQLLKDVYFIDERFVRIMVIPLELFNYLKKNPLFPVRSDVKELTERTIENGFDFLLNLKKLLLFISNKGLTLSQSERLRQADMKRSEAALIDIDINLFSEKSQMHQIEIILPLLRLFELVDLRDENVVLIENYEEFLKREPAELMRELFQKILDAADKRMVGDEVFLPIDLPFFKMPMIDICIKHIENNDGMFVKVLLAELIRSRVIMIPGFKVRDFKNAYLEQRSMIVSAMIYMYLMGMLRVDYPKRFVNVSALGRHFFHDEPLAFESESGAVILNADGTVVALPEKMSLHDLHLLKSFAELKEFDKVFNFQLTKESIQTGVMLGNSIESFKALLERTTRSGIPQALDFNLTEWSKDLPIVIIEESIVLLETADPRLTEALLGQIRGKKIVKKEISETALVIFKSKVQEVMEAAEKLEMIVKLIR